MKTTLSIDALLCTDPALDDGLATWSRHLFADDVSAISACPSAYGVLTMVATICVERGIDCDGLSIEELMDMHTTDAPMMDVLRAALARLEFIDRSNDSVCFSGPLSVHGGSPVMTYRHDGSWQFSTKDSPNDQRRFVSFGDALFAARLALITADKGHHPDAKLRCKSCGNMVPTLTHSQPGQPTSLHRRLDRDERELMTHADPRHHFCDSRCAIRFAIHRSYSDEDNSVCLPLDCVDPTTAPRRG